jgi:RNA polymerase sigma-70 factor (sigma-E family)
MVTQAIGALPETPAVVAAPPVVVPAGFDDAYPGLYRAAYRVGFRLLGLREEAADVAQEACARAFARWSKVAGCASPEGWAAHVAGNLAIDHWRKRQTVDKYAGEFAPAPTRFDDARVDLHRALATLPRRQRQVVVLRFIADLSEADVAAALGCSLGTVKSHASRGLAQLREILGDDVSKES